MIGAIPVPTQPNIGEIRDYSGTAAPQRWLFAYGQAISRTTYAALFAIISTTYGAGNGTTTFNVPDIRGRVIAGKDDMGGSSANRLTGLSGGVDGDALAAVGGEEAHAITEAELAAHNHGVPIYSGGLSLSSGSGSAQGVSDSFDNNLTATVTGAGDSHNNIQPTIILNKIIYTGV